MGREGERGEGLKAYRSIDAWHSNAQPRAGNGPCRWGISRKRT